MLMQSPSKLRLQEPAALNITSRINTAIDIVDLGLQRAKRPILTTKFGPHSAVILHIVKQIAPDIPVVWVNSGFNTEATLRFADRLVKELELNLHEYRPSEMWRGLVPAMGDPDLEAFAEHVKLRPFRKALEYHNPDVWVTAVRREQTEFRDGLSPFQKTHAQILKVCPLLDWRDEDMEAYLALYSLPKETDYYDPTKAEPHLECGLHNRL